MIRNLGQQSSIPPVMLLGRIPDRDVKIWSYVLDNVDSQNENQHYR
jgi:hypothetical protein